MSVFSSPEYSLSFPPKKRTALSVQEWLTVGFCAALPAKLSFAYICLLPALLLFWLNAYRGAVTLKKEWLTLHGRLIFFLIYAGIAAGVGLNPAKSLQSLGALSALSTTCFLIAWYIGRYGFTSLLVTFLAGQAIASTNTLLTYGSHGLIPRFFLSDISQAGQLAIGLVLGFGWFFELHTSVKQRGSARFLCWPLSLFGIGLSLAFFSTPRQFPFFAAIFSLVFIRNIQLILAACENKRRLVALLHLFFPLIALGLVVNLKRGPWIGAWAGIMLILLIRRPHVLFGYLGLTAIAVALFKPISDRLGATIDHFFIPGGRSVIWSIGWTLIQQFPLGIGWKNSQILRSFSYNIPPELTHFHNNLINLIVETGVLGAALYVWWIGSVCSTTMRATLPDIGAKDGSAAPFHKQYLTLKALRANNPAWLAVVAPLLAWQLAGIFEYNIGDKEVILAIYIVIGLGYAMTSAESSRD